MPKYKFGTDCTRATYKRMNIHSQTFKVLNYIKYNNNCTKKDVQKFVYNAPKYPSHCQFIWKNLLEDNLIEKIGSGNKITYIITPLGEAMIDYINRKHYKI